MHPQFSLPNIVFKHPVALINHLYHIYFRIKSNLSSSHPSSTLHGSAVYSSSGASILLKLLHCISKFHLTCDSNISGLK
jgi:hypothetical protein